MRIAECEQSHGNLLWNRHLDRLKADTDHKNKDCPMCSILNSQIELGTDILAFVFEARLRTRESNLVFSGKSDSERGVAPEILLTHEVTDCPMQGTNPAGHTSREMTNVYDESIGICDSSHGGPVKPLGATEERAFRRKRFDFDR